MSKTLIALVGLAGCLYGCDSLTLNESLDYQIANDGKQYQIINITNISDRPIMVSEMMIETELPLQMWMQCDLLEGNEFFEQIQQEQFFAIDFVLEPNEDYTCAIQFAYEDETTITNIEFR